MNKVIIINLNGRAYQLEEVGYDKLKEYLAEGATRLENDQDKDEIISDLEQAIAEKFDRLLVSNKTVVLEKEVAQVISEMGPVEAEKEAVSEDKEETKKNNSETKRLYKIQEGKMISGVCSGLAAYFNIDVVLIRIIFIGLLLVTHGAWLIIYIILAIAMPRANTLSEVAAAHGDPFTAQDFINRAREEFAKFSNKSEWKKYKYEVKQKIKQEKWARKAARYSGNYSGHSFWRVTFSVVILILFISGLITLISKGLVYGYTIPAGMPLWIAILIWIALYSFVSSIFKRRRSFYSDGKSNIYINNNQRSFIEVLGSFAFIVIIFWAIYVYVPETHVYFQQADAIWKNFLISISSR